MQTYRLKLPKHHPGQQQVVREAARFNALACGVRWGKTTFGIDRMILAALPGFPTAWYAPTNKSLADSWEQVKRVCQPITLRKQEQLHKLDLVGSGSIEMWSLEDRDASRGRKYKLAVIDEAAHVRHLEYAWTKVLRQRLTDYKGGAWFLSTPNGYNYFKRLFDRGMDSKDANWKSWQMPTSTNPFIAQSEIDDARKDMSEASFMQEYMAQFVSHEGVVFRNVEAAATQEQLNGPVAGREYVFGVDWGKTKDYTVVVVIDTEARAVVHMERWGAIEYTVQCQRLGVMNAVWRPAAIVAELNSIGAPIIETLHRMGLPIRPFTTTNVSKENAVEAVALAFERGDITIVNDPVLISELLGFEASRLPSGLIRYASPDGGHDDCVIALVIGWSVIDSYAPRTFIAVYDDPVHISPF